MSEKKRRTPQKGSAGRKSLGREGRSPARPILLQDTHLLIDPLDHVQGEVRRSWRVANSFDQFEGVALHVSTMREVGLQAGALVVVYPFNTTSGVDLVPLIVAPVHVSSECAQRGEDIARAKDCG